MIMIFLGAKDYVKKNIHEISIGGISVFNRKLLSLNRYLISFFLIPFVFLIRCASPFVRIRFGVLHSTRIGHYAANTEIYLCERYSDLNSRISVNLFCNSDSICNSQLSLMWSRTKKLNIWSGNRYLYQANKMLPGHEEYTIPLRQDRDINGLLAETPPHLSFTQEEEEEGNNELKRMGCTNGMEFICINIRDKSYLNNIRPGFDWSYHDYRDSDSDSFSLAAEELVNRNYFVFRMGVRTSKPFSTIHPNIVDYSKKGSTDFLDIYLGAKCAFYLGDSNGFFAVPFVFRRPLVLVNVIPFEHLPSYKNFICIPKKLWLRKERRFMKFGEILKSGAGRFIFSEQYEKMNIEIVDNSPEDIKSVIMEMDDRRKGKWNETEEDRNLQKRFWLMFKESEFHGVIRGRIGADFLRANQELL